MEKDVDGILDRFFELIKKSPALLERVTAVRNSKTPLSDFCRICSEVCEEISPMDIISYSDYEYDSIRKSTNGGGENSPVLVREDDVFELFMDRVLEFSKKQEGDHAK